MVLHCSFETFESDSDVGFMHEVQRVLRTDGKLAIVPLYLSHRHYITTSQLIDNRAISYGMQHVYTTMTVQLFGSSGTIPRGPCWRG